MMKDSNSSDQQLLDIEEASESDLELTSRNSDSANKIPLAAHVRPQHLDDFVGQEHLLAQGSPLRLAIESGELHSMILWGPPGVGKTTLAGIAANQANAEFIKISAVIMGMTDIRGAINRGKQNLEIGKRTIVFVDEAHRFNKSQQDSFLPYVENGTIVFVGATTENPSFEINNSLISRCSIYKLESLGIKPLIELFKVALVKKRANINFSNEQLERVATNADGDARKGLNILELVIETNKQADGRQIELSDDVFDQVFQISLHRFDKRGGYFYDFISALHKSIRGSSPDAALYWFCRLLDGGCDPLYIARRIVRIASEDVGNADPRALSISLDSWQVQERLGSPEGELAIAQAIIYLACAPKSNAGYKAYNKARKTVEEGNTSEVPIHLRNTISKSETDVNSTGGYRYSHDEEDSYSAGECYFPESLKESRFYEPTGNGLELRIREKLNLLRSKDLASARKRYS